MSYDVTTWAIEQTEVMDPTTRLILIFLAHKAKKDGTSAWPSQSTIAAAAGVSIRTAARHLAVLEEKGLIGRGDQELVSHFRPDRRPVVWNVGPVAACHPRHDADDRGDTGDENDMSRVADNQGSTSPNGEVIKSGARKRGTAAPNEFVITASMRKWAREKHPRVDIDHETPIFLDHHRAKGTTFRSWEAAWRTWIGKASTFDRQRAGSMCAGIGIVRKSDPCWDAVPEGAKL